MVAAGPIGAIALAAGGFAFGKKFGVTHDISVLREMAGTLWFTGRAMMGVPLNRITRRKLIDVKSVDKLKSFGFVPKTDDKGNVVVSEEDIANLSANFTDIALQLVWVGLTMLIKSFLFDEDDEEDSLRRKVHNALVNRCWQMATQSTMYINAPGMWKDATSFIAVLRFASDLYTLFADLHNFLNGNDIDTSQTQNRGRSKLMKTAGKLALPKPLYDLQVMMQDVASGQDPEDVLKSYTFGFGGEFREPFMPANIERMFKSEYKKVESEIEAKRAAYQVQLENSGDYTEEEIKEMKDTKYPTLTRQLNTGKAVYGIKQEDIEEFRKIRKEKKDKKKQRQEEKDKEILEKRKR